jgi:hypothetical protein
MVWHDPCSGVALCALTPDPDLCYSAQFNELSDLVHAACA